MPAINMGGDPAAANPSTGKPVLADPFSGPKGSPLDKDQTGNSSTGALKTGIGFGPNLLISAPADPNVKNAGFNVPYVPGRTMPDGTTTDDATLLAIGGGASARCNNGVAATTPYEVTGGEGGLCGFGNGATRDGNAGAGRVAQTATAAGGVAISAAITTGVLNRTGVAMTTGQTALGVKSASAGTWAAATSGTIDSTGTPNNAGKSVVVSGATSDVPDGTDVSITVSKDDDTASGSASVTANAYTSEAIDLTAFTAGTVNVEVSTIDRFGNTVTDTSTFAYAPA